MKDVEGGRRIESKRCPLSAELVGVAAIKCRFCGSILNVARSRLMAGLTSPVFCYAAFGFLSILVIGTGCIDPVQEQTERNKHAEEEKQMNALAAFKALPSTASPDQIVSVCDAIPEVRRALVGAGSVGPQSDVARRCADGFAGQAKVLLAAGKFEAVLASAGWAQRLGGGSLSSETEDVRQTAARAVALASFRQRFTEASDMLKGNPFVGLKAIEAAEEALSVARKNGADGATIDPLSKSLVPLAKRLHRAADAESRLTAGRSRQQYAATVQNNFYDNGLNITVRTSGPDATVLRLTFVLFDEVFIHNFEKGPTFDEAKKLGFKKAVLYDGYTKNWTWTF